MKLKNNVLKVDRELSRLDKIVLSFTEKLDEIGVKYVIISGYVAILTGRSRGTEDIDIIIEKMNPDRLEKTAESLKDSGYWCLNSEVGKMYENLEGGTAIRFAENETVVPNFKVSFPRDRFDKEALKESLTAEINSKKINISPLELQIAYKLYLGTEKDWEDALHLYELFKENIDLEKLEDRAERLKVGEELDELRRA